MATQTSPVQETDPQQPRPADTQHVPVLPLAETLSPSSQWRGDTRLPETPHPPLPGLTTPSFVVGPQRRFEESVAGSPRQTVLDSDWETCAQDQEPTPFIGWGIVGDDAGGSLANVGVPGVDGAVTADALERQGRQRVLPPQESQERLASFADQVSGSLSEAGQIALSSVLASTSMDENQRGSEASVAKRARTTTADDER